MEMTTKPSKEIQGEQQERARKIFISPVVPRFMSLWIGSLKWIADFQEIPGKAVSVIGAPAGHRTTVIPTNSQADVDNHILEAPDYSEKREFGEHRRPCRTPEQLVKWACLAPFFNLLEIK